MATQRTLKLNLLADVEKFGKGLAKAGRDAQIFGDKEAKLALMSLMKYREEYEKLKAAAGGGVIPRPLGRSACAEV